MPLYLDRHDVTGQTPEDVAEAHRRDLAVQARYGVTYLSYWFDIEGQRVNCLVDAPDAETAMRVHSEAHGQLANKIIPVDPAAVALFLGRATDPPQLPIRESATRTLIFTDMVGSTEHIDRFGDAAGIEMLRQHDQLVKEVLSQHGGRIVKHTGDGFMLVFDMPAPGLNFAIALQRQLAARPSDAHPLRVRIGIHTGEPVAEGDQLFGAAVNMAARLCSHAEAGGILVSHVVMELTNNHGFSFRERGLARLKGFAEPVAVADVVWQPQR
jgi:class 3 adenylate cyclase